MFTEPETLRSRLLQLRQSGHSLAELLTMDADRLDADGWPPSRVLSDDLRRFREQVTSLVSLWNPNSAAQDSSPFQSLDEIESEWANRERAAQALVIARKILQITTGDGQPSRSLVELHENARELIATQGMNQTREEILSLTEDRHAWCDLLRMIRQGGTLPDAEWTALNTSIEAGLGRTLAVAAARGRLHLPLPTDESAIHLPVAEETTATWNAPLMATSRTVTPVVDSDSLTLSTDQSYSSTPSDELQRSSQTVPDSLPVTAPGLIDTATQLLHDLNARQEPCDTQSLHHSHTDVIVEPISESTPRAVDPGHECVTAAGTAEVFSHSVFDEIDSAPPLAQSDASWQVPVVATPLTRSRPSQPSTISSSIFDDDTDDEDELIMDRDTKPALARTDPFAADSVLTAPSPLAERLLNQARFTSAIGPAASLATAILNGPEVERATLLPDLILHLIHEGRPGLAYHLSRCLESRSSASRPFVPSWLIRTWTYGHALVFHKGQLAGLLQDDLQSRSSIGTRDTQRDWSMALSLLVRAATLRPAIIAPGTRAAAVLRDFDLRDGCIQLYNYCSRIGAYGERIQGVFPGLFKQTNTNVPYSQQLAELQDEISRWQNTNETVAMKYEMASQLFQKTGWSLRAGTSQRQPETAQDWMNWQVAIGLGDSVIVPVTEDCRTELTRVKADVEAISTRLATDEGSEIFEQLSQPKIRAYLRQAMTFAQRWICLHSGAATSETQNYLPQAAIELRSEIQSRHEAVMTELQTLAAEHTSFEVRMAVACLMLSVQEIHDLVDPSLPTDAREADPRHLLHSELLKIPDLSLNSNWEPEADFHTLEDEILKFMSQPQPDWTTAFKVQLAQGNLQMADRILSLAIWTNEERDALQGVLELDRQRQRTHFSRELNEVYKLLTESVHLDILKASERSGFETRLTKLQTYVTSDTNVSSGFIELDRVREALVKRREREADRIRSRLRQLSHPSNVEQPPAPQCDSETEGNTPRGWVMDFGQ